jgi:hypothetical protein
MCILVHNWKNTTGRFINVYAPCRKVTKSLLPSTPAASTIFYWRFALALDGTGEGRAGGRIMIKRREAENVRGGGMSHRNG